MFVDARNDTGLTIRRSDDNRWGEIGPQLHGAGPFRNRLTQSQMHIFPRLIFFMYFLQDSFFIHFLTLSSSLRVRASFCVGE